MSKGKWDDLMKLLVGANPQHFVSWLLGHAVYKNALSTELKNRTIDADALLLVTLYGVDMILHIEFQRRGDSDMKKRLWDYNVLTTYLTGLTVCSFAIYLKKGGKIPEPPYEIKVPNGPVVHTFHFINIKLWEITSEELIQLGLVGLLPLLPWTKDGARREVVEQMINLLSGTDKHLLSLGISIAADVLTRSNDRDWLKRKVNMFRELLKDNWFLREIRDEAEKEAREEGLRQGHEEGLRQGHEEGLRQTLLLYVERRFVELVPLAKQQAELITDSEEIQNLMVRLFDARSVEEARQILLQPETNRQQN
jgi:predicted transposase YdaD